ncbi:MAG: DMT family transporter [Deltaproteobacteria bacterium]|nr:DMT family transporter [Deltaproteobacteria bacterium]
MIVLVLVTAVNGVLLSWSRLINAALGLRVGALPSSLINHLVGTVVAGLLLLVIRTGTVRFDLPLYYFCGGLLGVLVVCGWNYALPRIGNTFLAILVIGTQIGGSAVIDHFGLLGGAAFPISTSSITGLALLLIGAILAQARPQVTP